MSRFLAIAFLLAACSKPDTGPPCPQVVDHMLEVMKAQITGHDSVELGNRKQMIGQCERRQMKPATRRCLAAAKDLAGLATCQQLEPHAPPPAAPAAPAPAPAAPPAGSAGSAG